MFSQERNFKSPLNIGSEKRVESQLEIGTSEERKATELFPKIIPAVLRIILRNIEGKDRQTPGHCHHECPFQAKCMCFGCY